MNRVVRRRARSVSRRAVRRHVQPEWRFLGRPDSVVLDPPTRVRADRAALVEEELRVLHEVLVLLDEPPRPDPPADLFVRCGEKDHITLQRHGRALERDQRHELRDGLALHVERAASPDVAVLLRAAERIDLPVLRACEHDVHVIEQDERPRAAVTLEAGVQVGLPGPGFEHLRLDPLARQHRPEPPRRQHLVAGRIGRVDGDVLR